MKLAIVFPGQGSQSVGMMAGFEAHPAVRATFDEASAELLRAHATETDPRLPAEQLGKLIESLRVVNELTVELLRDIFLGPRFRALRRNMLSPDGDPGCTGCPIKAGYLTAKVVPL